MALWIWSLIAGGALLLLLLIAYRTRLKRRGQVHPECLQEERRPNADAHSEASAFGAGPFPGLSVDPSQDPSSVYCGQICFFESAEQRDMFEANEHRPVMQGSMLVAAKGQIGRLVQRSDDYHAYRQYHSGA